MDEHLSNQKESFTMWATQLQDECDNLRLREPDEYDWANLYREGYSPEEAARKFGMEE